MDSRMVIAFVLIGLIILVMPLYQRYMEQRFRVSEAGKEMDGAAEGQRTETGERGRGEGDDVGTGPATGEERGALERTEEPAERFVPREVVVEGELFRGVISTEGGTIRKWELKRFKSKRPDRLGDVQLAGEEALRVVGLGVRVADAEGRYDLSEVQFSPEVEHLELADGEVGEVRLVSWLGARQIEKVFRFVGDRYDFEMIVRLRGFEGDVECAVGWEGGILPTEVDVEEDVRYTRMYVYMGGERVQYKEKKPLSVEGRVGWACVRSKYFAVALVPPKGGVSKLWGEGGMEKAAGRKRFDMWIEQDVGREGVFEARVYLGPLKYEVISELGIGLERAMDLGWKWIRPIGKLVVQVLVGLRRVIPNYGVVIIVFSVLVKVVLYPLTRKSREAAVKMQKLQPEMARLREKYRGNRERLNREMMRLYKEHGANPLGGCFPMLLQMPILIALFTVFRNTIEFRQAEFISWWISDLSLPDPVFVLPILMGVSMFVQQKMTMKDPKQAAMVYVMPAVMIFLFAKFPAGLVLYYTMFNVLSLVEQLVMVKRSKEGGGA